MSGDVVQIVGYYLQTTELLADGPGIRNGIAVAMVRPKPETRYRRVWNSGYWAAVNDFLAGRLVVKDGELRAYPDMAA